MRADLRKEFATKKEIDQVETRLSDLEEDFDNVKLKVDLANKKCKEN